MSDSNNMRSGDHHNPRMPVPRHESHLIGTILMDHSDDSKMSSSNPIDITRADSAPPQLSLIDDDASFGSVLKGSGRLNDWSMQWKGGNSFGSTSAVGTIPEGQHEGLGAHSPTNNNNGRPNSYGDVDDNHMGSSSIVSSSDLVFGSPSFAPQQRSSSVPPRSYSAQPMGSQFSPQYSSQNTHQTQRRYRDDFNTNLQSGSQQQSHRSGYGVHDQGQSSHSNSLGSGHLGPQQDVNQLHQQLHGLSLQEQDEFHNGISGGGVPQRNIPSPLSVGDSHMSMHQQSTHHPQQQQQQQQQQQVYGSQQPYMNNPPVSPMMAVMGYGNTHDSSSSHLQQQHNQIMQSPQSQSQQQRYKSVSGGGSGGGVNSSSGQYMQPQMSPHQAAAQQQMLVHQMNMGMVPQQQQQLQDFQLGGGGGGGGNQLQYGAASPSGLPMSPQGVDWNVGGGSIQDWQYEQLQQQQIHQVPQTRQGHVQQYMGGPPFMGQPSPQQQQQQQQYMTTQHGGNYHQMGGTQQLPRGGGGMRHQGGGVNIGGSQGRGVSGNRGAGGPQMNQMMMNPNMPDYYQQLAPHNAPYGDVSMHRSQSVGNVGVGMPNQQQFMYPRQGGPQGSNRNGSGSGSAQSRRPQRHSAPADFHQNQVQPGGGGARKGALEDPQHARRSTWLDDFRLSKGGAVNISLQDVVDKGMVIELAADQYGSRFIQQRLETASLAEKEAAFRQLLPETLRLCRDVFGNYVIQKFFEHGTKDHQNILIERLIGNILTLSLQMYGCRVVQKAIDVASTEQQQHIVRELMGHVMQCVKDQNGNHVIQKCIEKVPPRLIQFVVEAFVNQIYHLSTHPYGCRVIQRLLEHCSSEQRDSILKEILDNTHELCKNQYGNYVIQHVLVHGSAAHRLAIIMSLKTNLLSLAKHKFASNVVEKCFAHANETDKEILVAAVLGGEDDPNSPLIAMVKDQYANYVIQTMVDVVNDEQRMMIVQRIKKHVPNLRKIPYGKHIISRIERLIGRPILP